MFHAARVHVSAFVISFGIDVTNHLETKLHCIASDFFFKEVPGGCRKWTRSFVEEYSTNRLHHSEPTHWDPY
jgi:hypothetical protein